MPYVADVDLLAVTLMFPVVMTRVQWKTFATGRSLEPSFSLQLSPSVIGVLGYSQTFGPGCSYSDPLALLNLKVSRCRRVPN